MLPQPCVPTSPQTLRQPLTENRNHVSCIGSGVEAVGMSKQRSHRVGHCARCADLLRQLRDLGQGIIADNRVSGQGSGRNLDQLECVCLGLQLYLGYDLGLYDKLDDTSHEHPQITTSTRNTPKPSCGQGGTTGSVSVKSSTCIPKSDRELHLSSEASYLEAACCVCAFGKCVRLGPNTSPQQQHQSCS